MDARTPQPDDGGSGASAEACPAGSSDVSGEYWRWCPRCGGELHNEKCKLRCRKCH
jgi:hypothetical protein